MSLVPPKWSCSTSMIVGERVSGKENAFQTPILEIMNIFAKNLFPLKQGEDG